MHQIYSAPFSVTSIAAIYAVYSYNYLQTFRMYDVSYICICKSDGARKNARGSNAVKMLELGRQRILMEKTYSIA